MRIFIIAMDDPVRTAGFIRAVIDARGSDIIGLSVPEGNRLSLAKNRSKFRYILSLFLIMGPWHFLRNSLIVMDHTIRKRLHRWGCLPDPTIAGYAVKKGIQVFGMRSPNHDDFLAMLKGLEPDIIINQSQCILKKEILQIPSMGILNRHNALLPRNRGRLAPFWSVYQEEKETGVSIHFVEEGVDAGKIIVREKFSIAANDTFNTLVKRCYSMAPALMLRAIDLLEQGHKDFMENDDGLATYHSTPTVQEAFHYRMKRLKSFLRYA
ncbi:MAG TPA: formyltransferase family protein [Bacteroidales bacterium]|nr:formyltransferase family protein [Bacteroidales bacterium]HRZ20223.1 formyltransferase family protein [Bacteroidales bacterium]